MHKNIRVAAVVLLVGFLLPLAALAQGNTSYSPGNTGSAPNIGYTLPSPSPGGFNGWSGAGEPPGSYYYGGAPIAVPSSNYTVSPGIICPQDAMLCPDGTWVGRSGTGCQFVCRSTIGSGAVGGNNYLPPVDTGNSYYMEEGGSTGMPPASGNGILEEPPGAYYNDGTPVPPPVDEYNPPPGNTPAPDYIGGFFGSIGNFFGHIFSFWGF